MPKTSEHDRARKAATARRRRALRTGGRSLARGRGSQAEVDRRRAAILAICKANHPRTVRAIFYLATVAGLVPKTEAYRGTLCLDVQQLRESGQMPFDWIVDESRRARWPDTWSSVRRFLETLGASFRGKLWLREPSRVMVFIESEGLAGLVEEVTDPYDVTLWPVRGNASITMMWDAAQLIRSWTALSAEVFVYALGDLDPAGQGSTDAIERKLREYGAEFTFERIGLNWDQATELDLPTRPTKTEGRGVATLAAAFGPLSVELDAVPVPIMQGWVRDAIRRHMSDEHLAELMERQDAQRLQVMDAIDTALEALEPD
jgi:hypothetical protein